MLSDEKISFRNAPPEREIAGKNAGKIIMSDILRNNINDLGEKISMLDTGAMFRFTLLKQAANPQPLQPTPVSPHGRASFHTTGRLHSLGGQDTFSSRLTCSQSLHGPTTRSPFFRRRAESLSPAATGAANRALLSCRRAEKSASPAGREGNGHGWDKGKQRKNIKTFWLRTSIHKLSAIFGN